MSKKQYFINYDSYKLYAQKYGLPLMKLVSESGGSGDWNLRENSELNLYGYSVNKSDALSPYERQTLLKQLMDAGLMSKSAIINHLEFLIHMHTYHDSYADACEAWREDLVFVNNYRIEHQRKVYGRFGHN